MGRETGRVTALGETWFPIPLVGAEEVLTEGLVDTGFEDFLSILAAMSDQLRLPLVGAQECQLADGSLVVSDLVSVWVRSLGRTRRIVAVLADSDEILIRTQLMRGHRLTIRYRRRSARLDPDR